ncbi:MAG: hypothetical protein KKB50_20925 [Planctomycetes bacterium]|nr:hypothetical protein [Planctomycetota bacterium]
MHDDQIGPFARLRFGGPRLEFGKYPQFNRDFTMFSSWRGRSNQPESACFAPETVILPLYHKIRIGLDSVINLVRDDFDVPLESVRIAGNGVTTCRLVWDIFLTTAQELKRDLIRLSRSLDPAMLWEMLEMPTARFIWRATGSDGDDPVIDVLYDATDVEQGEFLLAILPYSQRLRDLIASCPQAWLLGVLCPLNPTTAYPSASWASTSP